MSMTKDEFLLEKDELHQLYPYIWCTSHHSASNMIFRFKEQNIHQVINVSDEDHKPDTKRLFKECGIKYVWLKTHELARVGICKRGVQVAKLIREYSLQEKGTVVHCHIGKNRSISCILVARMLDDEARESVHDALAHIQSIRSIADPMPDFLKQLYKLQATLDEKTIAVRV